MTVIRAQVSIGQDTGLPADDITNTWHFVTSGAPSEGIEDDIIDALHDFYNVATTGGSRISEYFSARLNPATWTCRLYNLDDSPPRVPIEEQTIALSATATTSIPSEVALVMSFQALPVSGINQARRRNRVYLGPWGQAAFSPSSDGYKPGTGVINTIAEAGTRLAGRSDITSDWKWVVRSQTTGATANVVDGWVDNAWDTQRRRGEAASSRTLWT